MRDVGEKLVLEFKLLLAGDFQRAQQSLPFDCIAEGALQLLAGDVAFDQVVLNALVDGIDGQRLVVVPGKDHHRHMRSLLHDAMKSCRAMAVGKIQVEQHQRRCFHVQRRERVGQPGDTVHTHIRHAFLQAKPEFFNRLHRQEIVT